MRSLTVALQAYLTLAIVGPLIWWICTEAGRWRMARRRAFYRRTETHWQHRKRSLAAKRELSRRCQHPELFITTEKEV